MSAEETKCKKIQIISNPCIKVEGKEKIDDLRRFLETIELPPDSSNHYLFISGIGNMTLCVSDTEINSPIHAKFQVSMDLYCSNIEKAIINYLTEFWQKSIAIEEKRLQSARECYLRFSELAEKL